MPRCAHVVATRSHIPVRLAPRSWNWRKSQQSQIRAPARCALRFYAAGTGFTDSFIRRGRYPDFKGPLPFTPDYELVGVVEKASSDVVSPREGHIVADLCVVGGYAQYAIRPARFLAPVPDGIDAAEAVCIPLAYLTAFQMLIFKLCGKLSCIRPRATFRRASNPA